MVYPSVLEPGVINVSKVLVGPPHCKNGRTPDRFLCVCGAAQLRTAREVGRRAG